MDIETKEAVLKLAGVEICARGDFISGTGYFEAMNRNQKYFEAYARGKDYKTTVSLAYNTFLTRQNDVS